MMDKAATGASGQDLMLSVVVPIYNEADNIDPSLQRLERALDGLDGSYEVVCVDDGSTDGSARRLIEERHRNPATALPGSRAAPVVLRTRWIANIRLLGVGS